MIRVLAGLACFVLAMLALHLVRYIVPTWLLQAVITGLALYAARHAYRRGWQFQAGILLAIACMPLLQLMDIL